MNDNLGHGLDPLSPIDRCIGQRLAERRRELGLSENRLALALGLSLDEYLDVESGHKRAGLVLLMSACKLTGMQISSLFAGLKLQENEIPHDEPAKRWESPK